MSEPHQPIPSGSPAPAILGLDNVRLELDVAGIGSRTLAALVDYTLLTLLILTWWLGGFVLALATGLSDGWLWALMGFGAFALQWGYFALLEIAMRGQTPGKRAAGLRVISRHGGQANAGALIIRNLVRTVDLLIAAPMMLLDRRARRLGDLLAGTLVVHLRPDEPAPRLGRLPRGWGARQVAVIEAFLRRADELETPRAEELARRILRWIARDDPDFSDQVAGAGTAGGDPLRALRRVLAVSEEG